jgi:hypothetical protein
MLFELPARKPIAGTVDPEVLPLDEALLGKPLAQRYMLRSIASCRKQVPKAVNATSLLRPAASRRQRIPGHASKPQDQGAPLYSMTSSGPARVHLFYDS